MSPKGNEITRVEVVPDKIYETTEKAFVLEARAPPPRVLVAGPLLKYLDHLVPEAWLPGEYLPISWVGLTVQDQWWWWTITDVDTGEVYWDMPPYHSGDRTLIFGGFHMRMPNRNLRLRIECGHLEVGIRVLDWKRESLTVPNGLSGAGTGYPIKIIRIASIKDAIARPHRRFQCLLNAIESNESDAKVTYHYKLVDLDTGEKWEGDIPLAPGQKCVHEWYFGFDEVRTYRFRYSFEVAGELSDYFDFEIESMFILYSDLTGTVVNRETGEPVAGAEVELNGLHKSTGTDGVFSYVNVEAQTYRLQVVHPSYDTYKRSMDLSEPGDYTVRIEMEAASSINGHVKDAETGWLIPSALVECDMRETITDSIGYYSFTGLPPAVYTVSASVAGYIKQTKTVDASVAGTYPCDFALEKEIVPPELWSLLAAAGFAPVIVVGGVVATQEILQATKTI